MLAALDVLGGAGWDRCSSGAAAGSRLADAPERGIEVVPRGALDARLVAVGDAEREAARLAEAGFVVRGIPGPGLIRASVGAWITEEELERLGDLASPSPGGPDWKGARLG